MSLPGRSVAATVVDVNRRVGEVTDHLNRERGQILDVEAAGAATVRVTHKLGKVPNYFLVISKNANQDVWRDGGDPWDEKAVTFRTSGAVEAKVRVW